MQIPRPDALIFDMDGTLWDAADTYALAWNQGLQELQIDRPISRQDLEGVMGWERRKVLDHLLPMLSHKQQDEAFVRIDAIRKDLVRQQGGRLYDGVREGLAELSQHYTLFIVSNCPVGLIQDFLTWSELSEYITDEMAHGVNSKPKHHNMQLLIDKYELQSPIYIGDTDTDSKESRLAGVPFVFIEEGFGTTDDYDIKFETFEAFSTYFLELAVANQVN